MFLIHASVILSDFLSAPFTENSNIWCEFLFVRRKQSSNCERPQCTSKGRSINLTFGQTSRFQIFSNLGNLVNSILNSLNFRSIYGKTAMSGVNLYLAVTGSRPVVKDLNGFKKRDR